MSFDAKSHTIPAFLLRYFPCIGNLYGTVKRYVHSFYMLTFESSVMPIMRYFEEITFDDGMKLVVSVRKLVPRSWWQVEAEQSCP